MSAQANIGLFAITELPAARVATFEGQVDESNLDYMKSIIDPLVADEAVRYVILDFAKLSFINSKVIGYLASLYSRLAEKGKKLVFAQAPEAITDIITLVGLTKIIPSCPTLQEAVDVARSDAEQ